MNSPLRHAAAAGLASRVRDRIPAPVVDCAEAAMRQAETLAALRPRAPLSGSYRRPAAKDSVGLSPRLGARIAHTDLA